MKPQIIPMTVGGVGVIDLPDAIIVIERDRAPICEAFVAQNCLDPGPLFGVGRRSASACPDDNTPAAKTRPNRICLIFGMGLLRARVSHQRRQADSVFGDMLGIGRNGYCFHHYRARREVRIFGMRNTMWRGWAKTQGGTGLPPMVRPRSHDALAGRVRAMVDLSTWTGC